METHEVNYTNDRRQTPRNRFGWVRRLMQGQNRTTTINSNSHSHSASTRTNSTRTPGITTTTRNNKLDQSGYARNSNDSQDQNNNTSSDESDSLNNDTIDENNTNDDGNSLDVVSDIHSDNVSTTPLKSIISTQSTKEPSILSGEVNNDINSLNASTAETSLAPSASTPINYTFAPTLNNNTTSSTLTTPTSNNTSTTTTTNNNNNVNLNSLGVPDRDSESIVTLASSTRRIRRSIDTNCSTVGIPPASIMERLSVQPGNSNYANSIRTANDRTSQVEATSHYDDQDSSVTSF